MPALPGTTAPMGTAAGDVGPTAPGEPDRGPRPSGRPNWGTAPTAPPRPAPPAGEANPAAAAFGSAGGGARPALGGYTGPLGPSPANAVAGQEADATALAALESHAAQVRADAEARARELAPDEPEPASVPLPEPASPSAPASVQHIPAHDPIAVLLARRAASAPANGNAPTNAAEPPAASGFSTTPSAASYTPLADVPIILPPPSYESRLDADPAGADAKGRFGRKSKRAKSGKSAKAPKLDKHGKPRKPRPGWLRPAMGCLGALIVLFVLVRVLTPGPPPPPPSAVQVDPNVVWDERFVEEVLFVEEERNLQFLHPVPIEFLELGEFRAMLFEDRRQRELLDGPRAQASGIIERGLGFTFSDTSADPAVDSGVIYLEMAERIIVVDGEVNKVLRQNLVGQLAAALDDQHFDLSREYASSSHAQIAASLWGSDAFRIRRAFLLATAGDVTEARASSPGLVLADRLLKDLGPNGLDAYLANPPISSEFLFDPTQLDRFAVPLAVQPPMLRPGEELVGTDDIGPLTWLAVLSTSVDTPTAMRAVYGWGGDTAVAFTRDGRACTRIAVRGDTVVDETEIDAALTKWVSAHSEDRSVERVGNQIEVAACEPTKVDPVNAIEIANGSVLVSTLVQALEGADVEREGARCVSLNTVVAKSTEPLDKFVGLNGPELFAALKTELIANSAACDVYVEGITPTTPAPPTTKFTVDPKKKSAVNPWDPKNTTTTKPPPTTKPKATTSTAG